MTHQYAITGMTCSSCEAKIKNLLLSVPSVTNVETDLAAKQVTVTMSSHINTADLQSALSQTKYVISDKKPMALQHFAAPEEADRKSWLVTYKPLLLVFAFIAGISVITTVTIGSFDINLFMSRFMAGFFLAFSFFKFLDLNGFADSYSSYDILASHFRSYGLIYPFIELFLGVAYLIIPMSFTLNIATAVVMLFSSIGVIRSVVKKRKIRCACLGAVFNLPMSTITIIEDLLMAAMALIMIF